MVANPDQDGAPVSREYALSRAKYWIDRHYTEPERWERNDGRDLAGEIMSRAIASTLKDGETSAELEEKLIYCHRLVANLQFLGRTSSVEQLFRKKEADLSEREKTTVALYKNAVWRRYDVTNSFQAGRKSELYFDGSSESASHMAGEYLSRPWSRHGMIDWVFLDMMITREICMYGEQLKMSALPGVAGDYFKHSGDLAKMRGDVDAIALHFVGKLAAFVIGWVVPIAAIWLAFDHGYELTGLAFVGLFALSTVWWIVAVAINFGVRVYRRATDRPDPRNAPLDVLNAMFDVWRLLAGPVINPAMVKEAMLTSKAKGAVWDGAAWAIIDRAAAIDPAVLVATLKS